MPIAEVEIPAVPIAAVEIAAVKNAALLVNKHYLWVANNFWRVSGKLKSIFSDASENVIFFAAKVFRKPNFLGLK